MVLVNNTQWVHLDSQDLIADHAHLIKAVVSYQDLKLVETIRFNDASIQVMSHAGVLMVEIPCNTPLKNLQAEVLWCDSGEGMARLRNGSMIPFYACNFRGADSCYPHLVTNVKVSKGDKIIGNLSPDRFLAEIGLTECTKVGA